MGGVTLPPGEEVFIPPFFIDLWQMHALRPRYIGFIFKLVSKTTACPTASGSTLLQASPGQGCPFQTCLILTLLVGYFGVPF